MSDSPTKRNSSSERMHDKRDSMIPEESQQIDVDNHPLLANLKVDGKEIGAYMLCKFTDDVLGHRARQIFREKAASMKGQNGIYYYLKQIMKIFNQDEKNNKKINDEIELEQHQFRKLMASDPAFECLVAQEDTGILFQRIVNSSTKTTMTHMDFVEFCLLDRMQLLILLCKYWKSLRKLKLTDNELLDMYRRMTVQGTNESQMSVDHFGAAIAREFDIVLTIGEIEIMMDLMDYDGDGVVKPNDFETFYKDMDRAQKLIELKESDGIIDLKYSTNDNESAELKRDGYILYPKNLYEGHGTLYFWYKRGSKQNGQPAIESIQYSSSNMDMELISQGFICINGTKTFAKKFIWIKHIQAQNRGYHAQELGDIFITSGNTADEKSATLWMPPCREYKKIQGTLDDTNSIYARLTNGRRGVFLWVRYINQSTDVLEYQQPSSPNSGVSAGIWARVDELESQVRTTLRRRCPVESDGLLNFLKLFQTFDIKNRKMLSSNKLKLGLIAFGCKIDNRLYMEMWKRIDIQLKKKIDFETFQKFIQMTETEIDQNTESLQRNLTISSSNYRTIFKINNAAGDGILSRSDFICMLASAQILVSSEELIKIMHRFDVNQDNVVDYADFLKFLTGICDFHARQAARIADAAAVFQGWAIQHQNKKLAKDGNIDSSASWRLVKSYGDILGVPMIDKILRQQNIRLTAVEMKRLVALIAPINTNKTGGISRNAYHSFVNHNPKKIANLLVPARKIAGKIPENGLDPVFNKWNTLGHGKLNLIQLHKEFNDLAVELNIPSIDIKDFVYLVQHSGADCGGDGLIFLDRFLACLRDNSERRNMKHGFLTQHDSPQFLKGIKIIIGEIKRSAKTLDGKYDYRIPFQSFDKEKNESIRLCDFETNIREMGIGKYLNDQEIKSLIRRFHVDTLGGIDFNEFCRFITSNHDETNPISALNHPKLIQAIKEIFIQLPQYGIESFAKMIKQMCSIADKEGTGYVSAMKFEQVFNTLDINLPRPSKTDRPILIQLLCELSKSDEIQYNIFCNLYVAAMTPQMTPSNDQREMDKLLEEFFIEIKKADENRGGQLFDFNGYFNRIENGIKSTDLNEILWLASIQYPFSSDEISMIYRTFLKDNDNWDVEKFCQFTIHGLGILHREETNEKTDVIVAHLQEKIKELVGNDTDAARFHRLFLEFDVDNNGSISNDEFLIVLEQMGLAVGLTDAEKKTILNVFDSNQDNSIDYTEFFHFANHADLILQTIVDPSKKIPEQNKSPPKIASPEKLNEIQTVDTTSHDGTSPNKSNQNGTRSPTKSPTKEQILALKSNGTFTKIGKQLYRLAQLDKILTKSFPFLKYFEKYKTNHEATISWKKFQLILEKFLDTILEIKSKSNIAIIDLKIIENYYIVKETGKIKYLLFLRDFNIAKLFVLELNGKDLNDDDDDFYLSDSDKSSQSDSDENTSRQSGSLTGLLDRLLDKSNWSHSKCIKCMNALDSFGSFSKPKLFIEALKDLKLPWKKSELNTVVQCCRVQRHRIESAIFVDAMREALERRGCTSNSFVSLKPLMGKIYQAFLQAAQRNINARQLLERCDVHASGTIPWSEFLTVLRLMDCPLDPSELAVIQKALHSPSSCPYRSFFSLLETYGDVKQEEVYSPRRLLPSQAPPTTHYQPHVPYTAPPTLQMPPMAMAPQAMSYAQGRYVEQELQSIFANALRTIDSTIVLSCFRKYDVKGCGFISLDGFHAVMRQLGILLAPDIYSKVAGRFAARFTEGIDYVEFCDVVGLSGSCHEPSPVSRHMTTPMPLLSHRETKDFQMTPKTVESWLQEGATEREKQHFNEMYNSIFEYKTKTTPKSSSSQIRPTERATPPSSWSCPVCFHAQNKRNPVCEICAAKNPTQSSEFEVVLQCPVCAYRNKSTAVSCSLCQTTLKGQKSPHHAAHSAVNDGWLT